MPSGVYPRTDETKEKIRRINLGKKLSEETKMKMSIAKIGNISTKGKPWSKVRRKAQDIRGKNSVVKNGKEYSPEWHKIRREIYKRDNWICQDCGVKCHNSVKIQCHHIDYNEKNNDFFNLITLCISCHAKTNFKREDWIKYFKEKERYLYAKRKKGNKGSKESGGKNSS